jgi:hypothetical protein
VTLLTEPPAAPLKKIPYNTFGQFKLSWNPVAGPMIVTFWMFIVCPAVALVRIAPLNSGLAGVVMSVAEMM